MIGFDLSIAFQEDDKGREHQTSRKSHQADAEPERKKSGPRTDLGSIGKFGRYRDDVNPERRDSPDMIAFSRIIRDLHERCE